MKKALEHCSPKVKGPICPVPTTPRNASRKPSSEAVRSSKSCHAFHRIRDESEKSAAAEDEVERELSTLSTPRSLTNKGGRRDPNEARGDPIPGGGDSVKIEHSEEMGSAESREQWVDSAPSSAGLKPPRISAKSISTDGSEGRDLPEYCEGASSDLAAVQLILEGGRGDVDRSPSSLRNETVSSFLKSLVVSGPGNEVFDAPVKGGFTSRSTAKNAFSLFTCVLFQ